MWWHMDNVCMANMAAAWLQVVDDVYLKTGMLCCPWLSVERAGGVQEALCDDSF
jgi:hypothetical protein